MMEPSLPIPEPSLSFWHRTTRTFPHLHANRHAQVPASTEYLIIGSGLSGVLTASELIKSGVDGSKILMLEAREAVSGASGRNAGHIRPDAFRGFLGFSANHGAEQARKVLESEKTVLEKVREFVETNQVDCDFHYTSTFDVCLSQEFADHQAKSLAAYRDAGGDVSHVKFHEGDEARRKTRHPGAICAYEWPAASNHPAKLTQWLLSDVVKKGVKLWTHCPATKMTRYQGQGRGEETSPRWQVQTPRGTVSARTVAHCTNAYAAYLLPAVAEFLQPHRAQAHSYVPPASASGDAVLGHTMSLRYSLQYFFSVIQTRGTGAMIWGGALTTRDPVVNKSLATFDDRGHSNVYVQHSKAEFAKVFAEGHASNETRDTGLEHAWTGILGMTPDNVPMVGAIEGLEGQWICAGFNGHGMARIFLCAPGLARLMTGKSWDATGLPECFRYSQKRLDKYAGRLKASL